MQSEEFYRVIADSTYDWEEWIGPDSAYRYISPSVERITGYTPAELMSAPELIRSIIYPEDLPIYEQHRASLTLENQPICELEFRILHRSGQVRWIGHCCQPVTLPDGAWGGRRASNRDITQSKQDQVTMDLYQRLILAMLDDPNQVHMLLNPAGEVLFASPTLSQRLNISMNEMVGQNIRALLPPEIAKTRSQVFNQVLETGKMTRFLDQGFAGFYDTSVIPMRDSQGKIISVAVVSHDISERVRTEQALRASEERYRKLVEASSDGIVLAGMDGQILEASQQFLDILGYASLEEMHSLGKTAFDLITKQDVPRMQTYMQRMFAELKMKQVEFTSVRKDGRTISTENSGVLLFDDQGQPQGFLGLIRDVSERMRAEQALSASEERYRKLVETSPDGMVLVNMEGRVIEANQQFLAMLGYDSLADLQKHIHTLLDFVPEHQRSRLAEDWVRNPPMQNIEYLVIHKDGSWIPVESSVAPLLDETGQPYAWMGLVRDLRERKRAEKELRESYRIISALLNAPSDIALVLDPNAHVLYANETAASNIGIPLADVLGKRLWDFFPAELVPRRKQAFERALQTGRPERIEDPMPGMLFDSTVFPALDEQGEVTHVAIFAREITERVRAEQALRESEERYRKLAEVIADGIVMSNLKGQILDANQKFLDMMGYESLEELQSSGKTAFDMVVEQDRPHMIEQMLKLLTENELSEVEFANQRKDGSSFPTENSGVVLFDTEGQPKAFLGSVKDISERKQARQALEQRVAERTAELAEANLHLREEVAERQRAEERIRRHARRAEALAHVAERLNAHMDLQSVLKTICKEAYKALGFPIASVQLYNETNDTLKTAAAVNPKTSRIGHTPVHHTLYDQIWNNLGPIAVIPDLQKLSGEYNLELYTDLQIRTTINAKLVHDGELIGALVICSTDEVRQPSQDELVLIKALADQAAAAIAHARLFEQVSENQERLKALSQKLVETQEAERQHLARELHDEIGQKLTYLTLLLDTDRKPVSDPTIAENVQHADEVVKQILQNVRDLSLELRPGTLDTLGLVPTLNHHFEDYTRQTGIRVHFKQSACDRRFPSRVEITAFRTIQEALTNVVRYAKTDTVQVRLWCDDKVLGLQVEDSGQGFNAQEALASGQAGGLSGIQERISLCNGELEIESTPGSGTCLTAEIPIAPQGESQ
ncbi:MAG: PAS domain S-box protein [Chloroflexota bacterium]